MEQRRSSDAIGQRSDFRKDFASPRKLQAGGGAARRSVQTTAEYALVILAAAAVALVLIAWTHSSGKLPAFFDQIIDMGRGECECRRHPYPRATLAGWSVSNAAPPG